MAPPRSPRRAGRRAAGAAPSTAPIAASTREDLVLLESCTTTWAFETERRRFARLPRGMTLTSTSAEWRPYSRMWFDLEAKTLVVSLDEADTNLLQSDIHNGPCGACGAGVEQ